MAWKSYHEKLLNTEFAWDRNSLSQADTVSDIPCLSDKDMVRESVSTTKKKKATGSSGVNILSVKYSKDSRRNRIWHDHRPK